MTETLKPCPFCGGEGWLITHSSDYTDEYSVRCGAEGCCEVGDESKDEAIAAWNTRARDSDASSAEKPQALSPEGVAARAESIAETQVEPSAPKSEGTPTDKFMDRLTRPIVGIGLRTADEVFSIMVGRIRLECATLSSDKAKLEAALRPFAAVEISDARKDNADIMRTHKASDYRAARTALGDA